MTDITEEEKTEWSQFELIPVGLYDAEIVKIEKVESPFEKEKFQYQFYFRLNYRNIQGELVEIRRLISRKLSLKSKLFELLAAIDGEKPTKTKYPEGIRPISLIGKKCRVMIRHQESKDGNVYSKIDMFLPLEKKVLENQEAQTVHAT